jgi:hypothetical protein
MTTQRLRRMVTLSCALILEAVYFCSTRAFAI